MPEFTPSRSDAIRDELINLAAATLHGDSAVKAKSTAVLAMTRDGVPSPPRPRHPGIQWAAASVALVLVGGVVGIAATAAFKNGAPSAGGPAASATPTKHPTTPTQTPSVDPLPFTSPTPAPTQTAEDFSVSRLADLCSTVILDERASNPAYDDVDSVPRLEEARAGRLPDGSWAVAIPTATKHGDGSIFEGSWICTVSGTPDDVKFGIRGESTYVVDDNFLDEAERLASGGE